MEPGQVWSDEERNAQLNLLRKGARGAFDIAGQMASGMTPPWFVAGVRSLKDNPSDPSRYYADRLREVETERLGMPPEQHDALMREPLFQANPHQEVPGGRETKRFTVTEGANYQLDKALEQAMNFSTPMMAGPLSFHGTPKVYERPSDRFIGSGVGNAVGAGHYSSSHPLVSDRRYRDALLESTWHYGGKPVNQFLEHVYGQGTPQLSRARNAWWDFLNQSGVNSSNLREHFADALRGRLPGNVDKRDWKLIADIMSDPTKRLTYETPPGSLFAWHTPDNSSMKWGEMLADQPEILTAIDKADLPRFINELSPENIESNANIVFNDRARAKLEKRNPAYWTGQDLYQNLMRRIDHSQGWKHAGDPLEPTGGYQQAAKRLRKAGVTGHEYEGEPMAFDRNAGSVAVPNYVTYTADDITPLGRWEDLGALQRAMKQHGYSPNVADPTAASFHEYLAKLLRDRNNAFHQ